MIAALYGLGKSVYTFGSVRPFCGTQCPAALGNVKSHRFVAASEFKQNAYPSHFESYDIAPQLPSRYYSEWKHCATHTHRMLESHDLDCQGYVQFSMNPRGANVPTARYRSWYGWCDGSNRQTYRMSTQLFAVSCSK